MKAAMRFTLTELEHHPVHFDVQYNPGEIDLTEELSQQGPLHAQGKTEFLKNTLGEIRVRGEVRADLSGACDRCLEPASFAFHSPFDLFYRPTVKSETHAEVHLADGEVDLAFYEGDGLNLTDVLREFILLSLPMQHLCRPDCKGLCPDCGANLNTNPCQCAANRIDPRWQALKNL
jgi:uncharacterized protein